MDKQHLHINNFHQHSPNSKGKLSPVSPATEQKLLSSSCFRSTHRHGDSIERSIVGENAGVREFIGAKDFQPEQQYENNIDVVDNADADGRLGKCF